MAIRLFDSLTRQLKELRPAQPDGVFRFYNCGPTVYAPAHIGNFRTFVVNDVIRRLLELEFPGKVKHVRNLTDVDDKTIRRARDESRPLGDVTKQWTDKFHADCAALNCLPPHHEPRAADPKFIHAQVAMINVLMEKGNAYRAADGSVYFKVSSYPGYGALSRVKERELQVGSALSGKPQTADADEKEDGSDFALWKAWKPDDGPNKWDGPRGAASGRPGWHIECSAMSKSLLGDTIDLHTGGEDLLFPHHENEIAQSECCNGKLFAHHWYHSKHLLVDGKKMSKSLGNLYTLDDLKQILGTDYSAAAVRYALLAGHPSKQLSFSIKGLRSQAKTLLGIRDRLEQWGVEGNVTFRRADLDAAIAEHSVSDWGSFAEAWKILCDDLNTPGALGAVFTAFEEITDADIQDRFSTDRWRQEFLSAYIFFEQVLGIHLSLRTEDEKSKSTEPDIPPSIRFKAEERWAAKQAKDFAAADAFRKELTAAGWSMLDGKDGFKLEPIKKP